MTISSFNARLTHTVSIVNVTISAGARSESVQTNVPARVAEKRELIRTAAGDRLASNTVVYLKHDANVSEQDEIIVDGKQRPIVKLVHARDEAGVHHLEAYLS